VQGRAEFVDILERQRGFLFPWVPVFMGVGIAIYFALRVEPTRWMLAASGAAAFLTLVAIRLAPYRAGPLLIACAAALLGFAAAGARAHLVAGPVLDFRYYGPIEGRIVAIDRSASDAIRLTLDRVVLKRVSPDETPTRVRVALHGTQDYITPEPGLTVILTGHLAPPEGPVEPGGYDFQRQAWFRTLGAVGYTRTPVLMLEPPVGGLDLAMSRLRARLSAAIQTAIPGQPGAFAATILTGDRSGLDAATSETLRASNLSHLLAISGLHMVLLCGTVFGAVRFSLALVPPVALRFPIRKIAAVAAILAGLFYYFLSGRAIPAERAFIMAAVMFGALVFDRRAISLRSVALAALIVMSLRPETLTEPGFQMSFSATIALVAAFGALRGWDGPRMPRWVAPIGATFLSSAVAGFATAPFAAAHFNRIADYGLIANMLAVPVMGIAVMPFGVLAGALAPFGLGHLALQVMDWPIRWILAVAAWVSSLDGAVTPVVAPPDLALPLITLGGLFVVLWQARPAVRALGVLPLAAGFLVWTQADRPALLVSGDGALMGLMTEEGRVLSKPRGQGFSAESWLEDDGDGLTQAEAAGRQGFTLGKGEVTGDLGGVVVRQFSGKGAVERAVAACDAADVVILAAAAGDRVPTHCRFYDSAMLRKTGPLAFRLEGQGVRVETTRARTGDRLWNRTNAAPDPETDPDDTLIAAAP